MSEVDEIKAAAKRLRGNVANAPQNHTRTSGVTIGVWINSAYHLATTPARETALADWLDGMAGNNWSGNDLDWSHSRDVAAALSIAREINRGTP